MNKVKSTPIPEEIDILYPWAKIYKSYDVDNNCIASYIKDENTGKWKDNLPIEIAQKELEKANRDLQKAVEKA